MADEEVTRNDGGTAVAERPQPDAQSIKEREKTIKAQEKEAKRARKKHKDEDEYEVEFETPFGKLEFEFEPESTKKRKDEDKRKQAERDNAKAAIKAEKAAKQANKHKDEAVAKRGGSKLLPVLLIFGIVAAAVIIAIWLFARPGEEDLDAVPSEFRNDEVPVAEAPQGFAAQARQRISDAIHAGRKASREAQREQQERFEGMTKS